MQGSADSNYSQPSSDLSLDEEKETLRREKERQALTQLEKARVSCYPKFSSAERPGGGMENVLISSSTLWKNKLGWLLQVFVQTNNRNYKGQESCKRPSRSVILLPRHFNNCRHVLKEEHLT